MDQEKKLMGVDELGRFFGVSKPTVYAWVKERRIPFYRVAKSFRFDLDEVLEHIRNAPERPFRKE